MPAENANIARHLARMAAERPLAPALRVPKGRTSRGDIDYLALDFRELDAEVSAWVGRLAASGIHRGDRTLVMVPSGLPLIAAVFALFRMGAVPVVIDPGMGLGHFLQCVRRTQPRGLVGIPIARLLSRIFRGPFRSMKARAAASASPTDRLAERNSGASAALGTSEASNLPTDLAAILFTSGSTGAPKGVRYEHGRFDAQIRILRETYGIAPGEIDLPMLPIFALFNPALGMATVVPEIDPRHPARADPARIVQAIRQEQVTSSFGSPTLWGRVARHCLKERLTLPSLKRVLCAGAPVPQSLWASAPAFLTGGVLHSPYGATEALPVCSLSGPEWAGLPAGPGACVGRPVREIEVRIIEAVDGPLASIAEASALSPGSVGEIIVRGPVVTQGYDGLPEATALAKIPDGGTMWHRMGDCGRLDGDGRLWFFGRKAERVETAQGPLFTEPCEAVFRAHPRAPRCALVGLGPRGAQVPAIVAEARVCGRKDAEGLAGELRRLALADPKTATIRTFFFRPDFPVDVRHNAKIHRLALGRWAAGQTPVVCEG